jgi:methanogenic corrinoid protein MtbC1
MALKFYKIDVLTHELNKASLDLNLKQFAFEIVAPLFRSVGQWVQEKKLTIAQEHTISAMTKFIIGKRINHHYESGQKLKLKMIIASPKGELHSLSLLISSLLCAFYHVDFIYLGENLEEEAIADAAKSIQANIVLVGYSSASECSTHKFLEDSVTKLSKSLNPETKIWVGGAVDSFKIKSPIYSNVISLNSFNVLDEKLKEVTSF